MAYIPHTDQDIKEMLQAIGAKSIEELFQSIPANLRLKKPLNLPAPLSEPEVSNHLKQLAAKNISTESHSLFLGGGCYHHLSRRLLIT